MKGNKSVSTTMRARKVIYDEYTGAFYVETRVEALERQVATRAKLTHVLNRSQDSKLRLQRKQDKSALDIFERKMEKEEIQHKETLRDHKAHVCVLQELARQKAEGGEVDNHLGSYGMGASKLDIQELIQKKLKDSTPSAKRKQQSKKILGSRRSVKVFDRTKTTSALLRMKDQMHSRPISESENQSKSAMGKGVSKTDKSPKLILPPITVRWPRHKMEAGTTKGGQTIETGGTSMGKSVFITDAGRG